MIPFVWMDLPLRIMVEGVIKAETIYFFQGEKDVQTQFIVDVHGTSLDGTALDGREPTRG